MNIILEIFQLFLGIILIIVGGYNGVEENNFRYIKTGFLATNTNIFRNNILSQRHNNKREENLTQTVFNHRYENFNKNCGGIFKSFQTIIYSPNYSPSHFYSPNMICDYRIESPIQCPNEFHIQFLVFELETSNDCEKDFLNIQNELLCGQIIGIKRYNTTDGILRMRFQTDNEYENKGFKLLITRQPCIINDGNNYRGIENQNYKGTNNFVKDHTRSNGMHEIISSENLIGLHSTPIITTSFKDGNLISSKEVNNFQNFISNNNGFLLSGRPDGSNFGKQSQEYQHYSPTQFPQNRSPSNVITPQFNFVETPYNYINFTDNPKRVESQLSPWLSHNIRQCCANNFRQKHFYLSSPGFPRPTNSPHDCLFYIERFSPNICRLRIEFKFFNFGIPNRINDLNGPQVICLEDFIEIDGQRLCGCQTDLVYTSQWGLGAKLIRMRFSGRQIKQNSGFILNILQEDCPYRYQRKPRDINYAKYLEPNAILETNATIRTNLYLKSSDVVNPDIQHEFDDTEEPSSQFFFEGNQQYYQQNRCVFTPIDYFRLTIDLLWISKPICATRNYFI